MGYRLTDRDCYASMIHACSTLREMGHDIGVELPTNTTWAMDIKRLANDIGVPVRSWGSPECSDGPRMVLDHAPSAYGGGVRPMICEAGKTGEHTPPWWCQSAGLGPGAVKRNEFCNIMFAIANVNRPLPGR